MEEHNKEDIYNNNTQKDEVEEPSRLYIWVTIAQEKLYNSFNTLLKLLPKSLELDPENKERVWNTVDEAGTYTKVYWLQMFLSSFIAALGLLQNSTAVVIGAMLVAPLLSPIQSVAYAIASARTRYFWKHLKVLVASTVLAIATGFLVSVISPIDIQTAEVLSRVSPNFLDLLIAVASGAIAFLALSFRSLSASIAGVAMAASLVPPLAASGITLALGVFKNAWGSFFLYFTNLIAILAIGILIFFLFGYRPHQQEDTKNTARRILALLLIIVGISIPLIVTLSQLAQNIRFDQDAQEAFDVALEEYVPEATITSFRAQATKNKGILTVTLALPESTQFYTEDQERISEELAEVLDRDMNIDFTLLRTASVQSVSQRQARSIQEQLKQSVREVVLEELPNASIISIDVSTINGADTNNVAFLVRTVLASYIESVDLSRLEENVREKVGDTEISFSWIPVSRVEEKAPQTPEEVHITFITNEVMHTADALLSNDAFIENVFVRLEYKEQEDDEEATVFNREDIEAYSISFDLYAEGTEAEAKLTRLKEELTLEFRKDVFLRVRIIPLSVIEVE